MKIVILDGYTLNPGDLSWSLWKTLGTVTLYDRTEEKDIVNRIGDAEIVITNKTPLSKETLEACHIKYIGVLATGYNVVDVDAAKDKKIVVTNVPAYGTETVAQYVFALLLEICHHVGAHNQAVHEGQWTNCPDFCFWNHPLIELNGKTFGLIGAGKIGLETAKIAEAFGMKILAHTRTPDKLLESNTFKFANLDTLYKESDVISLHCPLTESTKGMINTSSIHKMKDGVILINTSRGPLIVEADLKEALLSRKVYAAGIDVLSSEPPTDNVLLSVENCVITPHIAWATQAARVRLMQTAIDNLKAFLQGTPINEV
ncbi:MAG: D-2-hydroxyacid dehydrogenase [Clostridiales bacterium]|nr:D-2-hydroxyacid dehydrogenase [Clostridiales bacterium]